MAKKKLINQLPTVNSPMAGNYASVLGTSTPKTPINGASRVMPAVKSYSEFMNERSQPVSQNNNMSAMTGSVGNYTYQNYVNKGQPVTPGIFLCKQSGKRRKAGNRV